MTADPGGKRRPERRPANWGSEHKDPGPRLPQADGDFWGSGIPLSSPEGLGSSRPRT